jgi:hypothetical protein
MKPEKNKKSSHLTLPTLSTAARMGFVKPMAGEV